MQPKLSPAGDRAFLVELGSVTAARLHASAAAVRDLADVLACVPGQQSLYVVFSRAAGARDEFAIEEALGRASERHFERRTHRIEVSFAPEDAIDLPELLSRHSLSRDEFLSRVAALRLTARYLGFRAGFAYLDGWPAEWSMPRQPTSRARVPRGSFAIAGATAGFYAVDSPGGWNILGRTAESLWDPGRTPPNMIAAGDEITIVPVGKLDREVPPVDELLPPRRIEQVEIVANAQFVTTVTAAEWNRVAYGLPPGGPFDAAAAAAANRLVGNADDAPLFECALLGPQIRFLVPSVIAWSGAECDLPRGTHLAVTSSDVVNVGRIRGGLRGWLAIGSETATTEPTNAMDRGGVMSIGVVPGPHETPLREITCEVTPQLNRVGIRMRPLQPIAFDVPADLPSCGMQFGTIQLHPDGTLVAMGPDHPVTGGYLQPMTVRWDERWKLGQLKPGDRVTFSSD